MYKHPQIQLDVSLTHHWHQLKIPIPTSTFKLDYTVITDIVDKFDHEIIHLVFTTAHGTLCTHTRYDNGTKCLLYTQPLGIASRNYKKHQIPLWNYVRWPFPILKLMQNNQVLSILILNQHLQPHCCPFNSINRSCRNCVNMEKHRTIMGTVLVLTCTM
jgi:hypothetical protein